MPNIVDISKFIAAEDNAPQPEVPAPNPATDQYVEGVATAVQEQTAVATQSAQTQPGAQWSDAPTTDAAPTPPPAQAGSVGGSWESDEDKTNRFLNGVATPEEHKRVLDATYGQVPVVGGSLVELGQGIAAAQPELPSADVLVKTLYSIPGSVFSHVITTLHNSRALRRDQRQEAINYVLARQGIDTEAAKNGLNPATMLTDVGFDVIEGALAHVAAEPWAKDALHKAYEASLAVAGPEGAEILKESVRANANMETAVLGALNLGVAGTVMAAGIAGNALHNEDLVGRGHVSRERANAEVAALAVGFAMQVAPAVAARGITHLAQRGDKVDLAVMRAAQRGGVPDEQLTVAMEPPTPQMIDAMRALAEENGYVLSFETLGDANRALEKEMNGWRGKPPTSEHPAVRSLYHTYLEGVGAEVDSFMSGMSDLAIEKNNEAGGSTHNLYSGDQSGRDVWMVGIRGQGITLDGIRNIPDALLRGFIKERADLLSQPEHHLGTWWDDETNANYIDISKAYPNLKEAIEVAQADGEHAIYNLKTGETVRLDQRPERAVLHPENLPQAGYLLETATKEELEGGAVQLHETGLRAAYPEVISEAVLEKAAQHPDLPWIIGDIGGVGIDSLREAVAPTDMASLVIDGPALPTSRLRVKSAGNRYQDLAFAPDAALLSMGDDTKPYIAGAPGVGSLKGTPFTINEVKHMALVGRNGARWYHEVNELLERHAPGAIKEITAYVGALGANRGPLDNLILAARAAATVRYLKRDGKLTKENFEQAMRQAYEPKYPPLPGFTDWTPGEESTARGGDITRLWNLISTGRTNTPTGRKLADYTSALRLNPDSMAADRHVMGALGYDNSQRAMSYSTAVDYAHAMMRVVADRITADPTIDWNPSPMEIQAALFHTHRELASQARARNGGMSQHEIEGFYGRSLFPDEMPLVDAPSETFRDVAYRYDQPLAYETGRLEADAKFALDEMYDAVKDWPETPQPDDGPPRLTEDFLFSGGDKMKAVVLGEAELGNLYQGTPLTIIQSVPKPLGSASHALANPGTGNHPVMDSLFDQTPMVVNVNPDINAITAIYRLPLTVEDVQGMFQKHGALADADNVFIMSTEVINGEIRNTYASVDDYGVQFYDWERAKQKIPFLASARPSDRPGTTIQVMSHFSISEESAKAWLGRYYHENGYEEGASPKVVINGRLIPASKTYTPPAQPSLPASDPKRAAVARRRAEALGAPSRVISNGRDLSPELLTRLRSHPASIAIDTILSDLDKSWNGDRALDWAMGGRINNTAYATPPSKYLGLFLDKEVHGSHSEEDGTYGINAWSILAHEWAAPSNLGLNPNREAAQRLLAVVAHEHSHRVESPHNSRFVTAFTSVASQLTRDDTIAAVHSLTKVFEDHHKDMLIQARDALIEQGDTPTDVAYARNSDASDIHAHVDRAIIQLRLPGWEAALERERARRAASTGDYSSTNGRQPQGNLGASDEGAVSGRPGQPGLFDQRGDSGRSESGGADGRGDSTASLGSGESEGPGRPSAVDLSNVSGGEGRPPAEPPRTDLGPLEGWHSRTPRINAGAEDRHLPGFPEAAGERIRDREEAQRNARWADRDYHPVRLADWIEHQDKQWSKRSALRDANPPPPPTPRELLGITGGRFLHAVRWGLNNTSPVRYGGMLSSTLTHLNNIFGNSTRAGLSLIENAEATALDQLYVKHTGKDQALFWSQLPKDVQGRATGLMAGLPDASRIIREGIDIDPAADVVEARGLHAFDVGEIGIRGPVRSIVNRSIDWPQRLLVAADTIFRSSSKGGHVASLVEQEVQRQIQAQPVMNANVSPKARHAGIMASLDVHPDLVAQADHAAARDIFQEHNPVSDFLGRFLSKTVPGTDFAPGSQVAPFKRVPINIMLQGLDYAGGYYVKALRELSKHKGLDSMSLDDRANFMHLAARGLLGTEIMVAGGLLSAAGAVTTFPPLNPAVRDTLDPGWLPASFKWVNPIGGESHYVPLALFGPAAMPILIGAVVHQAFQDKPDIQVGPEEFSALAAGLSQYVFNQASLGTALELVGALSDETGKSFEFSAERFLGEIARQHVPNNALLRQIDQAAGTAPRQVNSVWDAIKATVPGLSGTLEPQTTVWGDDRDPTQKGINAFVNFTRSQAAKHDPLLAEARRIGVGIPRVRKAYGDALSGRTELTPEELTAVARQRLHTREALAALVDSPWYQGLNKVTQADEFRKVIATQERAHEAEIKPIADRVYAEPNKDVTYHWVVPGVEPGPRTDAMVEAAKQAVKDYHEMRRMRPPTLEEEYYASEAEATLAYEYEQELKKELNGDGALAPANLGR